jgi:hypothetical protein
VKDIALFGAPKTELSLRQQVDGLLSNEEKSAINERMTGFYATAAAAETRGAKLEGKKPQNFGLNNSYESAPAAAPAPPTVQPKAVAQLAPPADEAPAKEERFAPPQEEKPAVTGWNRAERLEALKVCLNAEVRRLGVGVRIGPSLTVRYRGTRADWHITLEGALPVDACVRSWFQQEPPPDAPTWQSFDVPL